MGMSTQERSARYHAKKRAEWLMLHGEPKRVGGNRKAQTFKQCESCGQTFGPVECLAVKYCSRGCRQKGMRGRPSAKRGQRFPELQRAEVRKCLTCETEFRAVKDHHRRKQLYCTHTCYLKNRRQSSFEMRVMECLRQFGMELEVQARRGHWTFDAAVVGTNVLVEADGEFWHRGDKVKARDERKNLWCDQNGYTLVRIPELEFYKGGADVILTRWENATANKAERLIKADPQYQVAGNARPTG